MKTAMRVAVPRGSDGAALVTAVVLLALAAFAAGSMLSTAMGFARTSQSAHWHDKAAFLADAGIRAAVVKLDADSDGRITYAQSRDYFSSTNAMLADDWGFETTFETLSGRRVVTSTGSYAGRTVRTQADVELGAGSRNVHALYAHALYAGNEGRDPNYVLKIGGTGSGADFVNGDAYCGNDIQLTGDALLRLPEDLNDRNVDGIYDSLEDTWRDAFTLGSFDAPITQAEFDAYLASMQLHLDDAYSDGVFNMGEAFVDTIGNGVYDEGEPFEDDNGNGLRDDGDDFTDRNGNGVYDAGIDTVVDNGNGTHDAGEVWTEDQSHSQRKNNKYDQAGGYWSLSNGNWVWKTTYKSGSRTYSCASWPAESYEDAGDGSFDPGESYTDQNGVYDVGEQYVDDRNGIYDYGTQATGTITGMPAPGAGQTAATGGNGEITPPDLVHMYYGTPRTAAAPVGALSGWGHDIAVTASDYTSTGKITDKAKPEHIFLRNPSSRGQTRTRRINGTYVDDYFLEDPTDSSYNNPVQSDSIDGTTYTAPMYIDVQSSANEKLYFVDGNLYIHSPVAYSMRFKKPGTRITIVAKGNITISDEFYYNADYDEDLERSDLNSTVVKNPSDALCLIALKDASCASGTTGNIYIGDQTFGTGGSIHAMLYAENDFVDNNLNTSDQQFISVYGNMSAGNKIRINRPTAGITTRTRLDVTLDPRIRNGQIFMPSLPHAVSHERSITVDTAWHIVAGTWHSDAMLEQ